MGAGYQKSCKTEQERQEHERAIGRPQPPPPAHVSAAWALMNQFHIFSATRQKTNRYTGKPKGLEHIELLRKLMILVLQKSPEGVPKMYKMLLLVLYEREKRQDARLTKRGKQQLRLKNLSSRS